MEFFKQRSFIMRFFPDYSPLATMEFKKNLEETIEKFDRASDGSTYTLPTATVTSTLLAICQTVLSNVLDNYTEYANYLNGTQLAIPVISAFIILICNKVKKEARGEADGLIATGVRNNFFNTTPTIPADDMTIVPITSFNQQLAIDAIKQRLRL